MVPATPRNLDAYLAKEPYKTDKLNVSSFKFYADGALGSRGAALREEYSDKPGHFGQLVQGLTYLQTTAQQIANWTHKEKSDVQRAIEKYGDL